MEIHTNLLSAQVNAARKSADLAGLNRLNESLQNEGKRDIDKGRLKEACLQFEAIFLREILKDMRKFSEAFSDETKMLGMQTYWDIMDSSFAEEMAKTGALGVGNFVYQQLIRDIEIMDKQSEIAPPGKIVESVG